MARQEIKRVIFTCDICGKQTECEDDMSELIIRIHNKPTEHYDLCKQCADHCLETGISRVSSNRQFMSVAEVGAKLEAVLKALNYTNKDYASRKGWPEWLVSNIRHDKYKFQGKKGDQYRETIETDYIKYCHTDASTVKSISAANLFDDDDIPSDLTDDT